MTTPDPKTGDTLLIGRAASVQFSDENKIVFRVIGVCPMPTYRGWIWLTGYQLDRRGNAVEKREIFVRHDGLQPIRRTTITT